LVINSGFVRLTLEIFFEVSIGRTFYKTVDEIPLLKLIGWFEKNVSKTSTLAVVRSVVQGNFPLLPTSAVASLGKNWRIIEAVRDELGDPEFSLYVQCQMEGFKRDRSESGEGFYLAYIIEDRAQLHYEEFRERFSYNGFHTVRSEIFRNVYPAEVSYLKEYFRLSAVGEEEPDWFELKTQFILTAPPIWVYYGFSLDEVRALGAAREKLWISGKTRLLSKKLEGDRNESRRAAFEALYFAATQFNPIARTFTVVPEAEEEFPLVKQVGFQFRSRKAEFIKDIPPFKVTFDAQSK
jgi:hypothetical protein